MLEDLIKVVRDAGAHLLEWRAEGIFDGRWEGSQFKARVDGMANDILVGSLTGLDDGIPVISEEVMESQVSERPERYWLIDPIDGTASFIGGYSGFVTQVALMINHAPELTAIYAPALDLLYTSRRGLGAWRNQRKLDLLIGDQQHVLIDNYPQPRGMTKKAFEDLKFRHYLESGSISLKICRIADQTADLFFKEIPVKSWDIAPPHRVLEEVGGVLTDIRGQPIDYRGDFTHDGILAANSKKSSIRFISWYTKRKTGDFHD